jgi:phage-related minor tail protein
MDDEIDRMMIGVRADTAGFARDVAQLRDSLEGSLGQGADKAGRSIETSLLRAVQSGRLGFDTLRTSALSALDGIAAGALKLGLNALIGGGSGSGGAASLGTLLAGLVSGSPGRATGGPVSPGRAYVVGERGPELFVPTASGRVDTGAGAGAGGGGRDVRVAITINAPGTGASGALQQSGRQVARAVKAALAD